MRLRTQLRLGAGFLVLLGVAASGALYLTAAFIEDNSKLLLESVEGMRAAEEVKLSLGRAGTPAADARAKEEVDGALDEFEPFITPGEERQLVEQVRRDMDEGHLHEALVPAQNLVNLNRNQAREVRAENDRVDEMGKVIALVLAAALVVGSLAFLVWLRRSVDRPLAELRRSLSRFKGGARQQRLPVQGPEELRQIAGEFNEMADNLALRDQLQLEFLAGVAHDLRGPLNMLKLSAQAIGGAPVLPPPEQIRASLKRVSAQVDHLSRMIDDLLDRTRIEAGNLELHLDVCDVRPLVSEVVDLHRLASDQHHLEIVVPGEPVLVRGDATRLVQVMTNLISNAIKYSPAGGAIRVTLEAAGGEAAIGVADEGIGISPEDREHIFEPFRRSTKGPAVRIPGVGLGLSVSRRLVQAHGGEIEVEARPEGGSLFRIRLPLAGPADVAGRANGGARPGAETNGAHASPSRTE